MVKTSNYCENYHLEIKIKIEWKLDEILIKHS